MKGTFEVFQYVNGDRQAGLSCGGLTVFDTFNDIVQECVSCGVRVPVLDVEETEGG